MGVPLYLFKKYKITYYEKSWQHTLFYILSLAVLFAVYGQPFFNYFSQISAPILVSLLCIFLFWLVIPIFYKNDYFTKKERLQHQIPKFFEILFQQLCFLAGLLTFNVSSIIFALIFFIIHIPIIFFLHKKLALVFITGSLVGGLIFAYLQPMGVLGFLFSLSLHLSVYLVLYYALSIKHFWGITPIKRWSFLNSKR